MPLNAIFDQVRGRAHYLLGDNAGLPEILKLAQRYAAQIQHLADLRELGELEHAERLARRVVGSFVARVSATVSVIKKVNKKQTFTLQEVMSTASSLSLDACAKEPVVLRWIEEPGRAPRQVCSFGFQRRAFQKISADILDALLPGFEFDYLVRGKGADRAMLRIQELIEKGGYDHVVTIDITKCFRSAVAEQVEKLLPLPLRVVRHALLVGDEVPLKVVQSKEAKGEGGDPSTLGEYVPHDPDTAARQGLPQGASTSTLIMSRAVLGPLLLATGYGDRLVLYGDDVLVCAKGKGEASEIFKAIGSALQSSPVGPLTIGRSTIKSTYDKTDFLKYRLRKQPELFGGGMRISPSGQSWKRYRAKVRAKCSGTDPGAAEDRVFDYSRGWPEAYPLWEFTEDAKSLMWQTANEEFENALGVSLSSEFP